MGKQWVIWFTIFSFIFVNLTQASYYQQPSSYSALIDSAAAYAIATPPPHPAGKLISDLIGNCSCPAMKQSCEAIVVYRQNTKIVPVTGESRPVYLRKEKLQELPIRQTVILDKDFVQPQKQPSRSVPLPVDLIKEILREEIEYYDVIVDRIEIQYNDVDERIILEVEEADIREEWVEEPVPVQLKEETLNVVEEIERIWLSHEIPNQINDTIPVQQNVYDIRPVKRERDERIDCDNYRIVKVPRDDCHQARKPNGYLPPE